MSPLTIRKHTARLVVI
jgi:hypothetical protein